MKKFIMITLVSLIVNTNIIYAECTTKDREYFKSIEDKYQVAYEFNKDTKTYTLNLTYGDISSFSYELSGDGIDNSNSTITNNKIVISNLVPGKYVIYIVGSSENCNGELKREEITLPKYNQYAYDSACEGIEEFALCSPTYDKEIDYKTFISRVNSYKKNKSSSDNTNEIIEEQKKPIEWLTENYMHIIYFIIGILSLFLIVLIAKVIYNNERKRRRLE